MKPLISVIVPVYNVEIYLEECIQSILNQIYTNIEIILVDDCSTDKSPQICDKFSQEYPNIVVIHKDKNEGLGMACNTGINNASGDYIAFCDSDDYIDPEMYNTMYTIAQAYKCDAVFSGLKRIDSNGQFLGILPHYKELTIYRKKSEIDSLICNIIASAPNIKTERLIQTSAKSVLYHKSVINKGNIQFVSERIIPSEDLIFNIDILANSNIIGIIPQAFYNYRINPKSITRSVKLSKFNQYKQLYIYISNQCNKYNINGDIRTRIQRLFIGYIRSYISNICLSSIPNKTKKEIYRLICKDCIWETIWKSYPRLKMTIYHYIFLVSIHYKLYFPIFIINKIKSYTR